MGEPQRTSQSRQALGEFGRNGQVEAEVDRIEGTAGVMPAAGPLDGRCL